MQTSNLRAFARRLGALTSAFALATLLLAPAYASDTEVYAREVDFSGDVTPTLMMVLDSSGSMRDCLENCPGGLTKIGALRQAMRKVLFGDPQPVSGGVVKPAPDFIKMGYARFNPNANNGGWMRYPALRLGSVVPDAYTDRSALEVRLHASPTDVPQTQTVNDVSGTSLYGSSYLVGNTMSALGLRFTDLQIPRNATITGAQLHFTRSTNDAIPFRVRVAADQVGDAAAFTATGTAGRSSWGGDTQLDTDTSPSTFFVDVTTQVQGVVNRSDWCGGNALALQVTSAGGSRTTSVWSYEGKANAAPTLIVSYEITGSQRANSCITAPVDIVLGVKSSLDDIEWPEGGGDSSITFRLPVVHPAAIPDGARSQTALRFASVPVLAGATIDKAWLYTTSARTDTTAASLEVRAFDTDNVAAFCTQDANTKAVSCTPPTSITTAATLMALPANTSGASTDGVHHAVDVTAQVASVTGRGGWRSGNAMGFLLRNSSTSGGNNSTLYTVDSSQSRAAFLHVVARKRFTNLDDIDKTARQDLYDDISARLYASGGTPLGDAYAEAARYLMGMAPYSTDSFLSTFEDQVPEQSYTQPDPRTASGGTYTSPLEQVGECSANYIYVMSDGEPNNASNVQVNTKGLTTGYNLGCDDYKKVPKTTGATATNFACMMSLAQHLASGVNQRKAVIRTNTVLFDNAITGAVVTDMEAVSRDYGKGQFFHAKTSSQLTDSLLNSLSSLLDQTGSMTAPGVAVNQFNRLTHLDQLYYAVFDPDALHARWRGNVKRYRLVFGERTLGDGTKVPTSTIVDRNGKPAIDPSTTFFATTAESFWGTDKDGNNALLGGAASMLPDPATRRIYTYLGPYSGGPYALVGLNDIPAATGRTTMGLTADAQFNNVRNWLKGYRVDIVVPRSGTTPASIKTTEQTVSATTLAREEMGGVLHSQPVLVNYGYTSATPAEAQADASKQDNTLFFSSMEGMLHAVDANTGIEQFAFMPRETLLRADEYIINDQQDLPEFGMDSTWTVLRKDGDGNLKIASNGTGGDKVWIFGGMRMGGRSYYALDVTNRNQPVLKWILQGGVTTGFTSMGQTWSKPVLGSVKVGSVVKNVLFFGGGYDPKHEVAGYTTSNSSDSLGNQLYIVDADTGSLLWSASSSGATLTVPAMKYSVTAEPRVLDVNNDGLADAVYFGDLGGQVFRVDIRNGGTAAQLGARVKLLATLGQGVTADTTNQRRLFESPSAAVVKDPATGLPYVAVAIGSGYRSHPLDLGTEDFFYVLKDGDVLRQDLLTATDLQPTITPSDLAALDPATATGATVGALKGWKMDFPETGEKMLSTPIILFGEVFFTTYVPRPDPSASKCSGVLGVSKLWRMGIGDGGVVRDANGDGVLTVTDRLVDGVVQGLGGTPQLIVGEGGRNAVLTGTGVVRNGDFQTPQLQRTRWYEVKPK